MKSKVFYRQFSIVKYLCLPTDTFRKHVERHVTWRKLALKFTGYCRQSRYTDSAVVFTLLPAVAWDLKSQFPPGYMHFNICFEGDSGEIWIFHDEKLPIEVFDFFAFVGLGDEPGLTSTPKSDFADKKTNILTSGGDTMFTWMFMIVSAFLSNIACMSGVEVKLGRGQERQEGAHLSPLSTGSKGQTAPEDSWTPLKMTKRQWYDTVHRHTHLATKA